MHLSPCSWKASCICCMSHCRQFERQRNSCLQSRDKASLSATTKISFLCVVWFCPLNRRERLSQRFFFFFRKMATAWLNTWLTDLSLSDYVVVFAKAGYTTPEQCATIRDREKLKSIGVSKLGHLNRLYRAIEKLGSEINGGGGAVDSSSTLPLFGSNSSHDGMVAGGGRATALQQSKSATMIPMSGEGMCLA